MRKKIPDGWEMMPFDELCSLGPEVLKLLTLEVLKSKMSVGDEKFRTANQIEDPEEELSPYWLNVFQTICNKREIDPS